MGAAWSLTNIWKHCSMRASDLNRHLDTPQLGKADEPETAVERTSMKDGDEHGWEYYVRVDVDTRTTYENVILG